MTHKPLKVVVAENGVYGSIRLDQEKHYPGRSVGTTFENPDLALFGRAYGFEVTRVETTSQLPSVAAALKAPGPQMVIVNSSVKAIMPAAAEPAPSGPRPTLPKEDRP